MSFNKFELDFLSNGLGKFTINEPIKFADVDWSLTQENKRYARDIFMGASGELSLEFSHMRDHQLNNLLYYYHIYGFEAQVNFYVDDELIGEIDFTSVETDELTYFKCKVIQLTALQIIKRRSKIKVDITSSATTDGSYIEPLNPDNTTMLLTPKRSKKTAKWVQGDPNANDEFNKKDHQGYSVTSYVPWSNNVVADLNTCRSILHPVLGIQPPYAIDFFGGLGNEDQYIFIAENTTRDITFNIRNLIFDYVVRHGDNGAGYTHTRLEAYWGRDLVTAYKTTRQILWTRDGQTEGDNYDNSDEINYPQNLPDKTITIPLLNPDDKVWINFYIEVNQDNGGIKANRTTYLYIRPKGIYIEVVAEVETPGSVIKGFRLIDVMKQVVKSISTTHGSDGLPVVAPIYDEGGMLYNTILTNGDYIRGLANHPFNISLDDLSTCITETNSDYQVETHLPQYGMDDNCVFFGYEPEFYMNYESAFIPSVQFREFNKTTNDRFTVNKFSYKYNKYQAKKELDISNSTDVIHGETEWVLQNQRVENEKSVVVGWIRDPFIIEEARLKALTITDKTAYNEDSTLFAIDVVPRVSASTYTIVDTMATTFISGNTIQLATDNTVNFYVLGVKIDSVLYINYPDPNTNKFHFGHYFVKNILQNSLILQALTGTVPSNTGNGTRVTSITYTIPINQVQYINATTEGFVDISGINSPETFSNMKYSIRRNIENFYLPYLHTCNTYAKVPIKNTNYIYNTAFKGTYTPFGFPSYTTTGSTLTEVQEITPKNPILTPYMYNDIVFADVSFSDFLKIQDGCRTYKGYIRCIDNNDIVIKVYPTRMVYNILSRELRVTGEEKFEPVDMTLRSSDNFIVINESDNGGTRILKGTLKYKIIENKVYLFDETNERLYNGVYWDNVSVNGSLSITIEGLTSKLNSL